MTYILLITSAVLNGLAQILWKTGLSGSENVTSLTDKFFALLTNLSFLGGFFLYGVSIILWIIVISKVEVSYAYPLLSLSYIVVMIGGYMLGEAITPSRAIGALFILLGIFFIARS